MSADVFTNIASTSRVDSTKARAGPGRQQFSGELTTTTRPTSLSERSAHQNSRTVTQPSGWNGFTSQSLCGGGACRSGRTEDSTNAGAYRTVSSSGSYTYAPTLSGSGGWIEALVAYKRQRRLRRCRSPALPPA